MIGKKTSFEVPGKNGGKARKMFNKPLIISSYNMARIQECQIFLGHFILEKTEELIIKNLTN
tara:strand:+ start:244 stop:429 length:186 start_codon:yes stop_codon:yes gene_type:complete